ncbi:formylglycine-generating enzyme family protein [Salibacterium aidingense]|uniref:formylglycine-generating enzyme family protein n=1 Tax=Salibacterium aidingense TaxID=384933 RepID=UPI000401DE23|nr:formylglycine-generating enzyme family protein [Salibacterium aidingense]
MTNEYRSPSPCCSTSRPPNNEKTEIEPVHGNIQAKQADKTGMVFIPGGSFLMGTNDKEGFPADGEGPVREKTIDSFYIDPFAVTNADFSRFVEETGYTTEAEEFQWSFVFYQFVHRKKVEILNANLPETPWWLPVKDAYWYAPEGKGSDISERMNHPVVHVSFNDALAYCRWAGKRLPTEVEWEYAARGGLTQKKYPWGDELHPHGQHYCNIWQGAFPTENEGRDGYMGTAPVDAFYPNAFGLYNVSGNVWEWCSDVFQQNWQPHTETSRVIRGGSYLCHHSYCNRYRVAARSSNTPDSSTGNMGFRCVTS